MGYPQPATTIVTDNSTANGIVNDTVKQQRSHAIDMRYHWVRDRIVQGQFRVQWRPGKENKADYFTKHHSGAHHQHMRLHYLAHCTYRTNLRQDCEGVLNPTATSSGITNSSPEQNQAQTLHWSPAGQTGLCASQPQRLSSNKAINGLHRLLKTTAITLY
jgi:hypothetical protein